MNIPLPEAPHIQSLAAEMFDRTRALHEMDDRCQRILEAAAQFIAQPLTPPTEKPLETMLAYVETLVYLELTFEEQKVLAAVLTLALGQGKRKDLKRFGLSAAQQRTALTLTALLRIAAGMDHSNSQGTSIQWSEPGRQGMWIVLEGEQAAEDASAAQQEARRWEKMGYPALQILGPEEAALKLPPFPGPLEKIGLLPEDDLAEAGRKTMLYHFAQMLRHEPATLLGEDIEALHDMRVATRRLRAAFEVFESAFEPSVMKPHLKGLRAAGRALGEVRDLDVFMEKANHYLESLPPENHADLHLLFEAWGALRAAARQRLVARLNSPDYLFFKRDFNAFLHTPGAGRRPLPLDQITPHRVNELAPVLIYSRLAAVQAFASQLENAPVERLHALRIEFKKLRYTLEYFREVLGAEAKQIIEEIKTLQDHLGDLNDAHVACLILQQFIQAQEQLSPLLTPESPELQAVHAYLAARQAEMETLIAAFPSAWARFERPELRRDLALAISVL